METKQLFIERVGLFYPFLSDSNIFNSYFLKGLFRENFWKISSLQGFIDISRLKYNKNNNKFLLTGKVLSKYF